MAKTPARPNKVEPQTLLRADDIAMVAHEDSDGRVRLSVPGPVTIKVNRVSGKMWVTFEATSITLQAGRSGKLRLNSRAWEDAKVILADQMIELSIDGGQVVVVRKERAR